MSGNWWDEELWLEYLEGESDPAMKRDLEVLLKNSAADRDLVERWRRVKNLVKNSDDVVLPEDGRVYDRIHDKIMSAVYRDGGLDETAPIKTVSRDNWGHSVVAVLTRHQEVTEEVT